MNLGALLITVQVLKKVPAQDLLKGVLVLVVLVEAPHNPEQHALVLLGDFEAEEQLEGHEVVRVVLGSEQLLLDVGHFAEGVDAGLLEVVDRLLLREALLADEVLSGDEGRVLLK